LVRSFTLEVARAAEADVDRVLGDAARLDLHVAEVELHPLIDAGINVGFLLGFEAALARMLRFLAHDDGDQIMLADDRGLGLGDGEEAHILYRGLGGMIGPGERGLQERSAGLAEAGGRIRRGSAGGRRRNGGDVAGWLLRR